MGRRVVKSGSKLESQGEERETVDELNRSGWISCARLG